MVAGASTSGGASPPATPGSQLAALRLTLHIEPNELRVQLHNPTDNPVRVWQLGNSWGGASWSLRLRQAGGTKTYTLRPSHQGYTVNLPRYIEVPPHGQQEVRLTPSRPEWTAGESLNPLRRVPLEVQAVVEIATTPESKKHLVAIGHLESAPMLSPPPHSWLFATPDRH
jgi:hypothetical protein